MTEAPGTSASSSASSFAAAPVQPVAHATESAATKRQKIAAPKDLTDDAPAPPRSQATGEATQGEDQQDDLVALFRLKANVVGKQYYAGALNNNELVYLVREPTNKYGEITNILIVINAIPLA
ncbi:hypothetical protein B484DRAFT_389856 [Ochromonadaceae sp. CCMP2298]|nr:hypothetical protein B484DRAFT_389856 [Ochromonadaceae sp. CCMP2298]